MKKTLKKRISKLKDNSAVEADVQVLSKEEIARLEKTAYKKSGDGKYMYPSGLYVLLLLYTGARCGEILSAKWSDYDEKNGFLIPYFFIYTLL